MVTILRYDLVKTRKQHICFGCLRKFEAGTEMFSWACVDSGQMNSGYNCQTCDEIIVEDTKIYENLLPGISIEIIKPE